MNNEASYYGGVYNRRVRALRRLEDQLKKGTKTEKVSLLTKATTGANQIPLEEVDVKRIKKEITTLKSKI
jgi:hypothetical protein